MSKTLAEAAREILTGQTGKQLDEVVGSEPMKTFKTANGAEVVDHGKAITHPLDGQQGHTDGDVKQDSTIPGSMGKQEPKGLSNPGSNSPSGKSGVPGDKTGPGTIDGTGASMDNSIRGADGKQDPKGMANPGSRVANSASVKPVKEDKDDGDDKKKSAKDCDGDDDKDAKKPAFLTKEEKEAAQAASLAEYQAALTEGEDLPEAFKDKAKTIFEAAVAERVSSLREEIEAEYSGKLEEAIDALKTDTENKLEDYMSFLAKGWLEENKLAVDSGIKASISEDFIAGIRDLCVEHNIEFPDAQIDVVEELTATVEELEAKLNKALSENVELSKTLNTTSREKLVNEAVEGLADTKAAKVRKLAEGVSAVSDEDFAKKLKTLRESYAENKPVVKPETLVEDKANVDHGADTSEASPFMKSVVGILDKKPTFTK